MNYFKKKDGAPDPQPSSEGEVLSRDKSIFSVFRKPKTETEFSEGEKSSNKGTSALSTEEQDITTKPDAQEKSDPSETENKPKKSYFGFKRGGDDEDTAAAGKRRKQIQKQLFLARKTGKDEDKEGWRNGAKGRGIQKQQLSRAPRRAKTRIKARQGSGEEESKSKSSFFSRAKTGKDEDKGKAQDGETGEESKSKSSFFSRAKTGKDEDKGKAQDGETGEEESKSKSSFFSRAKTGKDEDKGKAKDGETGEDGSDSKKGGKSKRMFSLKKFRAGKSGSENKAEPSSEADPRWNRGSDDDDAGEESEEEYELSHRQGSRDQKAESASPREDSPPKPKDAPSAFKHSVRAWTANLVRVSVNKTGELKSDTHVTGPVVRLHFVKVDTGGYVSKQLDASTEPARDVALPPLQTMPYSLKGRRQAMLVAEWRESLLVDGVAAEVLLQPGHLLLLELLQLPDSFSKMHTETKAFKAGIHKIAWAFLRLKAPQANGEIGTVRLQLYKYTTDRFTGRMTRGGRAASPLEVYELWHRLQQTPSEKRPRYPSYIEINIKATPHPLTQLDVTEMQLQHGRPNLRERVENERVLGDYLAQGRLKEGKEILPAELGRVTVEQLQGQTRESTQSEKEAKTPEETPEKGSLELQLIKFRAETEDCQVPNATLRGLQPGRRGCVALAFSPDGALLAAVAEDEQPNLFRVQVYETHSGASKRSFSGHHGLVYDISWCPDNAHLVTASADFTAKLWTIEKHAAPKSPGGVYGTRSPGGVYGSSTGPTQVFQHACFVYAAQCHPSPDASLVATGAYDCMIRLWDMLTGQPLRELCVHQARVNHLAFDAGKRLYSGDGHGIVKELSCDAHTKGSGLKLLRSSNELAGEPITCLRVHPQGRKLVVLTKTSRLCTIDLKLFAMTNNYLGVQCGTHPLKFDLSPDGRYVISGSEDGRVHLWEFQSGVAHPLPQLSFSSDIPYGVAWNTRLHAVAVARMSAAHPLALYVHDPRRPSVSIQQAVKGAKPRSLASPRRLGASRNHPKVPDQLTPTRVAEMLASLRQSKHELMDRVQASVKKAGVSPKKQIEQPPKKAQKKLFDEIVDEEKRLNPWDHAPEPPAVKPPRGPPPESLAGINALKTGTASRNLPKPPGVGLLAELEALGDQPEKKQKEGGSSFGLAHEIEDAKPLRTGGGFGLEGELEDLRKDSPGAKGKPRGASRFGLDAELTEPKNTAKQITSGGGFGLLDELDDIGGKASNSARPPDKKPTDGGFGLLDELDDVGGKASNSARPPDKKPTDGDFGLLDELDDIGGKASNSAKPPDKKSTDGGFGLLDELDDIGGKASNSARPPDKKPTDGGFGLLDELDDVGGKASNSARPPDKKPTDGDFGLLDELDDIGGKASNSAKPPDKKSTDGGFGLLDELDSAPPAPRKALEPVPPPPRRKLPEMEKAGGGFGRMDELEETSKAVEKPVRPLQPLPPPTKRTEPPKKDDAGGQFGLDDELDSLFADEPRKPSEPKLTGEGPAPRTKDSGGGIGGFGLTDDLSERARDTEKPVKALEPVIPPRKTDDIASFGLGEDLDDDLFSSSTVPKPPHRREGGGGGQPAPRKSMGFGLEDDLDTEDL
ncbi:hypothetical protein CYMTET_11501 [Cymbomonas tetramitiformis]|uniref:Uncharacterized protein n=1 Tax=Cymbomonas tetramitiformis TaxID=36881 RepID=A0AAE0GM65_9CHLO|nr:hypothetical protein CYMTET_11501 [Cymbomonas tetramitiformis]